MFSSYKDFFSQEMLFKFISTSKDIIIWMQNLRQKKKTKKAQTPGSKFWFVYIGKEG